MGPAFIFKFLNMNEFLDRRDLILVNGCLPLLYPANRFNFGEDFDGLKTLLATLPPLERPNLAFDIR
ncbi:hypothetical protein EYZ11_002148 [Aspergillus tanneri]|uniref:Uncharacterized protein n=1 Tax=Aspergillus tanneri TaxID=1220188 RepID=A0A4S3JTF8_9EURO|nr:hypothetical protein EYZ11_002148 [Aspergillus tanneri]